MNDLLVRIWIFGTANCTYCKSFYDNVYTKLLKNPSDRSVKYKGINIPIRGNYVTIKSLKDINESINKVLASDGLSPYTLGLDQISVNVPLFYVQISNSAGNTKFYFYENLCDENNSTYSREISDLKNIVIKSIDEYMKQ